MGFTYPVHPTEFIESSNTQILGKRISSGQHAMLAFGKHLLYVFLGGTRNSECFKLH